jgi:hypothetical protein
MPWYKCLQFHQRLDDGRELLCFSGAGRSPGGIALRRSGTDQSTCHTPADFGDVTVAVAEGTILAKRSRSTNLEQALVWSAQRLPKQRSEPPARHIGEAGEVCCVGRHGRPDCQCFRGALQNTRQKEF